jgi:hypothetical protein
MKNTAMVQRNGQANWSMRLMADVRRELRWTEMEYLGFQYDQGIAYLMAYLNGDEYSVNVMERSRIFWQWWKNHWRTRDESFLEQVVNTTFDLSTRREMYLDTHDAVVLAKSIYPNGVVLNESYAVMITELVESETQKVKS